MIDQIRVHLQRELQQIKSSGLYKHERLISGPQQAHITVQGGQQALNLCANNYLGLANHPAVIAAARDSFERWGYGMASVRFICGTQTLHKQLEEQVSDFLETEDTILYTSCFDANTGLFETLLGPEDAVISDALNHASIIDGIRLCKAQRYRYLNSNMKDLEVQLQTAQGARFRMIATDGVFSMDGTIANLEQICDLADQYDALVMVDDSHAVGVMGAHGRGTHEHCDVMGDVDIITGTFGKALGGASGGYTSGSKEIIALLRQRSRPYLFSNTLPPSIAAASLQALDLLSASTALRDKLAENTCYFRQQIASLGFNIPAGNHPIVPIMLGTASLAEQMANHLLELGVYVTGFSYPVVPKEQARIRVQLSAAHERTDLDAALAAFKQAGEQAGLLK